MCNYIVKLNPNPTSALVLTSTFPFLEQLEINISAKAAQTLKKKRNFFFWLESLYFVS